MLLRRIAGQAPCLATQFGTRMAARIRCCWLDNVIPEDALRAIQVNLPRLGSMVLHAGADSLKTARYGTDAESPTA